MCCQYMVIENAMPEMKNDTANESMLAPVKVLDLKNSNGTIGRSVRCSMTMNAANRTAASTKPPMMRESPQPRSPASINDQVNAAIAPVTAMVPGMSVAT